MVIAYNSTQIFYDKEVSSPACFESPGLSFKGVQRAARRPSSKVKPGGPGPAAGIEPLTQGTITFDDFKAEVAACGLGADWGGARLEKLFALFDLDGNGALDSDEFKRAARQLHTLLDALEDVPAKQALSAPRSEHRVVHVA